MSPETRRAIVLVVLTIIAVAVPAAAWWAAGISDAEERASRYETDLRREAEQEARAVAARAGVALARISELENRRPWRHYESAPAMRETPWKADPLVLAHFEIAAEGGLRLTEIGPEDPQQLPPPALLCTLRDELATKVPELWKAVRPECVDGRPPSPALDEDRDMTCVGPLTWTTVRLAGVPTLVALRHVELPEGSVTQGLIVDPAGLAEASSASPRAELRPGEPPSASDALVPLVGSQWHVAVDDAPLGALSAEHASDLRSGFLHAYGLGLSLAGIAAIAAILLAWQALRLARGRAELTAIAAHELRTPLAGIRLHAGMLASGLGDPSRAKEQARRVSDEAWRLSRVVHNLLDSAGRGGAQVPVRVERGDLGTAVRSAVATVAPALEAGGARIDVQVPADLPEQAFDGEAVTRIVHDLLDNAEKYSRGSADRVILVQVLPRPGGGVDVAVDDAGPGIARSERRKAFRPFTRLRRRDAPSGLGLGLSLARARARGMRGDLRCEESTRGGARFVLSLPPAGEALATAEPASDAVRT